MLGFHRCCTTRVTEERQFSARSASNDKLKVTTLWEVIFTAQHAGFEEVKGAWDVAFMVQNCAGWVGDAREVGTDGEPEVFVLVRKTLESL